MFNDTDDLIEEILEYKGMLYQIARRQSYFKFPKDISNDELKELSFSYENHSLYVDKVARQREVSDWMDEINELSIITSQYGLENYLLLYPHMMVSTLAWCQAIRKKADQNLIINMTRCPECGYPSIEILFENEEYDIVIESLYDSRPDLDDNDITFDCNHQCEQDQ